MSEMFLRVMRYKASRVSDDPVRFARELLDKEFVDRAIGGPDLRLSCYKVNRTPQVLARIAAEHFADADMYNPPRMLGMSIPSKYHAKMQAAPCGFFQFKSARHFELHLRDDVELRTLASDVVAISNDQWHEVQKQEIREYVRSCFQAQDPEWLEFVRSSEKAAKWQSW